MQGQYVVTSFFGQSGAPNHDDVVGDTVNSGVRVQVSHQGEGKEKLCFHYLSALVKLLQLIDNVLPVDLFRKHFTHKMTVAETTIHQFLSFLLV